MLPILTAPQIREADSFTISNEPISSLELMERAANECFREITSRYQSSVSFLIICGQGNNGGDGLVIAKLLYEQGYRVDVNVIRTKNRGSEDFEIQLKQVRKLRVPVQLIDNMDQFKIDSDHNVIIDSIFGTGLSGPADGLHAAIIHAVNTSGRQVISIDIPSGLFAEGSNSHCTIKNTIKASLTFTFQVPKLSFFLPDSAWYVGEFFVLEIGLDRNFLSRLPVKNYYLTGSDIIDAFPQRERFSHKGTYGHALLIAGSRGKTGAALLAAHGCLRAGAGLVTIHAPGSSLEILQTALPEAMVSADPSVDEISVVPELDYYSSVGVGPGLGKSVKTSSALKLLIQNTHIPLVLDADALNILAENKTWLSFLPYNSILTPHPGEFERLFGKSKSSFERLQLQRNMSVKFGIIIVLKGAFTSVSTPDGTIWFNSSGTPAMATAGSGDVLTGIICGLYAKLKNPLQSALAGVYIHGLAGELAAEEMGEESVIAGDIVKNIGAAIELLKSGNFYNK